MAYSRKRSAETDVSALIREQLGSEINARFLRGMPAFRAEMTLPREFHELLKRLDRSEARGR